MKTLAFFSILLLISFVSLAQTNAPVSSDRNWLLSGGVIVGQQGSFPLVLTAESTLNSGISVGGKIFRVSSEDDFWGDKIHLTFVGATANYHAAKLLKVTNDRFDPYAGATAGVAIISYDGESETSPMLFTLQVGSRYYFSQNLGGYAQISLGSALGLGTTFEVGLTYRLRK